MAWKSNLDIAIKNGSFGSVIKPTTCILKQRKNASNCCLKCDRLIDNFYACISKQKCPDKKRMISDLYIEVHPFCVTNTFCKFIRYSMLVWSYCQGTVSVLSGYPSCLSHCVFSRHVFIWKCFYFS